MKRREFITLLGCATACSSAWPFSARAQTQPSPQVLSPQVLSPQVLPRPQTLRPPPPLPRPGAAGDNQASPTATGPASTGPASIGQVATLQGSATVTRGNTTPAALKVSDPIYKNDVLQCAASSLL